MVEHGPIPGAVARLGPLRGLYKRAAKLAHAHIAASLAAQRSLSTLGVESALLHAGVDHERIRKAAQDVATSRAEIEAVVGRKIIGCYAGRIVENKGILDVARCVLGDPNIGLVVVGDGPEVPQLKKMIRDGGGNVAYLGRVEDATPLIAAADFGVLLTRDGGEGRPLFVTECAALGVPVIGTRTSPVMRDMLAELGSSHIKLVGRAEEIPRMAGYIARTAPALLPSWEDQAKRFEDWVGIAT
jgi:glycosyltransferase involved in cell wall biosynthesis